MPKKQKNDTNQSPAQQQNGASASIATSSHGKNKKSKHGHASMENGLSVSVPAAANGDGDLHPGSATPNGTIRNEIDLNQSFNNGMNNSTAVKIPTSGDDKPAGFDVARAEDGALIVRKLGIPYSDVASAPFRDESFLKEGDRITGVQILLEPLKYEDSVKLLNAILPYKPELYVKSEPDWSASMRLLSQPPTSHIGLQNESNGDIDTAEPKPFPTDDSKANHDSESTEA